MYFTQGRHVSPVTLDRSLAGRKHGECDRGPRSHWCGGRRGAHVVGLPSAWTQRCVRTAPGQCCCSRAGWYPRAPPHVRPAPKAGRIAGHETHQNVEREVIPSDSVHGTEIASLLRVRC